MHNPVLLDNTVLTNFAQAKCADLPPAVWPGRVYVTQAAVEEYRRGVEKVGLPAGAWDHVPFLKLTDEENTWRQGRFPAYLGAGECASIAAAFHRRGVFASDDLKARKTAQALKVPVVGSVGILIRSVQKGLLTLAQAQVLLDRMIDAGYYAPVTDLSTFFDR
jgi:predicted nucleic acid-binding protein